MPGRQDEDAGVDDDVDPVIDENRVGDDAERLAADGAGNCEIIDRIAGRGVRCGFDELSREDHGSRHVPQRELPMDRVVARCRGRDVSAGKPDLAVARGIEEIRRPDHRTFLRPRSHDRCRGDGDAHPRAGRVCGIDQQGGIELREMATGAEEAERADAEADGAVALVEVIEFGGSGRCESTESEQHDGSE